MAQVTIDIDETDGMYMKMPLCEGSLGEVEFSAYVTVSGDALLFHIEEKWYKISTGSLVREVVEKIVD